MRARLPWIGAGAVLLATATGAVLRLGMLADPATAARAQLSIVRVAPAFAVAAVVGALALRRGNRTGAALLGLAAAFAALLLGEGYAHAVLLRPGAVATPLATAAAWVAHVAWVPVFALLALVLLLLPDGRLPGPRWRWVAGALAAGATGLAVSVAVAPGPLDDLYPDVVNPLAVAGLDPLGRAAGGVLLAAMALCAMSLPLRYRRAGPETRQQLTWVMLAGVPALVATVVHATLGQDPSWTAASRLVGDVLYLAFFVAVGIAVVRHRLFDVDLVVNRAIVYGLLAAFVTAVYVAVVIGIGRLVGAGERPDLALSVAATALVAIGFAPVREWARVLANRWVYGERQAPYEVLTELGERLAGTPPADELLPAVARSAARGVGAASAEVRLLLPDGRWRVARWPDAPAAGEPVEIPLVAGEEVGRLAVVPRPGFPLTRRQRRLLDTVARQAAPALENARLTATLAEQNAQLRASRRRIVTVADDERRRLERDLHDGAQAQLVAVTLRLRALAGRADGLAPDLEAVREQVTDTLATLRDLARGVFPPQLAESGLAAALRGHLAKTRSAATLSDGIPAGVRPRPEVEAALWFATLEALQNAARHAPEAPVAVELAAEDGRVQVTVRDGGPGFDPAAAGPGTGLTNIADRMAAVDGTGEVTSRPGEGTAVRLTAPL